MQWHELPKYIERTELAQLIQMCLSVLNQAQLPMSLKCQEALKSSKVFLGTIIEQTILRRKPTIS